MQRVGLRQAFHGEPDMAQDGAAVVGKGPDQVIITVKDGTLVLRVNSDVPDNQVLSPENLNGFLELTLELEDGSQLTVTVNADQDDDSNTDIRLVPANERAQASEG